MRLPRRRVGPLAAADEAADLYYDVIPSTANIDGGTAVWSDTSWKSSASGTTGGAWATSDSAFFETIVGEPTTTTITLAGAETAMAVTFSGTGYTLTGGTLALAGDGATNWINGNGDASIESALTRMRFNRTAGTGTPTVTISGGGTIASRTIGGNGGSTLASVRQAGGSYTVSEWMMVGGNNVANSQGHDILHSGTLTVAQGIYLGWNQATSSGTFTQNGGFVETQNNIQAIQFGPGGGRGAYILNSGTLFSSFGYWGDPNAGSFTFGGGTFRARVGFDTNSQPAVTTAIAAGLTAFIDTYGQAVNWRNTLNGPAANGLVKSGAGAVSLAGNYTGNVSVAGGLVQPRNATSPGTGTVSATGTADASGAVDVNGLSFSNAFVLGNSSTGPSNGGVLQNTAATTSVLGGNVRIGGGNYVGGNGSITFNGAVSGGTSAYYSFYKQGAGRWLFANTANSFDGFYYQIGGTTEIKSLANLNQTSSLGRPTTTAQDKVVFGFQNAGGGTLLFTGSAASTSDRDFELLGNTAVTNRINASGATAADTLTLTGSLTATRSGGAFVFALGGTNAGVNTFSGQIANRSGTISLLKDGSTTWRLSGANTFTGSTTITGGVLEVASTGRIGASSGITLHWATAELRYNAAVALARPITFTQGTISGTSTIGTAVAVGSDDILSPGNSPGAQAYTGGLAWNPGGTYAWELNSLSGVAGTNWDILNVTGGLDLSALSTGSGSTFSLSLVTLTASNTAGPLGTGYVPGSSHTFALATFDTLSVPTGFSTAANSNLTSLFTIALSGWQGTQPAVGDISVRVNSAGTGIDLVIVPEPGALVLAGIGLVAAGWMVRRGRRAG